MTNKLSEESYRLEGIAFGLADGLIMCCMMHACCEAWNEYEKTLENKTPLWTRESFERFIDPMFKKWEEHLEKEPSTSVRNART